MAVGRILTAAAGVVLLAGCTSGNATESAAPTSVAPTSAPAAKLDATTSTSEAATSTTAETAIVEDSSPATTTTMPAAITTVTFAPPPLPVFDAEPCSDVTPLRGTVPGTLGAVQNADDGVRSIIRAYAAGFPDSYAGLWTDRVMGSVLVAFTEDVAEHQRALDLLLGEDPAEVVEVVAADHPIRELEATNNSLFREGRAGIRGGGVDVPRNRVEVSLGELTIDEAGALLAELPRHICYYEPERAPAELRRSDDEELRPVRSTIHEPTSRRSTEVRLDLTEVDCAAGEPIGDRLRGPVVEETVDRISIAFWVAKQPAQVCRDRHVTSVTVQLDAPIGDRTVIGNGRLLLATEDARRQDRFFEVMWRAIFALEELGYRQLGVERRTATSETFRIGRTTAEQPDGDVEVTIALGRSAPLDPWTSTPVTSGRFSGIERDHGAGLWIHCAGITLEVLTLADAPLTAEPILQALVDTYGNCVEPEPDG